MTFGRRTGFRSFLTFQLGMFAAVAWAVWMMPRRSSTPGGPPPDGLDFALVLAGFAFVPLFFVPALMRSLLMRRALDRLANAHGFAIEHNDFWEVSRRDGARGWVRGVPMRIGPLGVRSRDNELRRTEITGPSAHFDLVFVVRSRTLLERLWFRLGGFRDAWKSANAAFDLRFSVMSTDPARLDAFIDAEVLAAFCDFPRAWKLDFSNVGFTLRRGGWHFGPATERVLDAAARLAILLAEKRAQMPPATALREHVTAWDRFARARGLSTTVSPLAAWGNVDGVLTSSYAELAGRLLTLRFACAWPDALPFRLEVHRLPGLRSEAEIRRNHANLGVHDFDARFQLFTDRLDLARRALLPIADALVQLSQTGTITIANSGIALVEHSPGYPAGIQRIVPTLVELTQRGHAGIFARQVGVGAYR